MINSALDWLGKHEAGFWVIFGAITLFGGAFKWYWDRRKNEPPQPVAGVGGKGGNASVGGNGIAVGGRGGMSGTGGTGGVGGGAAVAGDGFAMGGDGGDAGVPWRPVLGAPSPLSRMPDLGLGGDQMRDEFGIYVAGRGGSGGDVNAVVTVDGRSIPLLPLLELLRIWSPEIISRADAAKPRGPQDFWETVMKIDPASAKAAVEHVLHCMDVTIPDKMPAPDPYKR